MNITNKLAPAEGCFKQPSAGATEVQLVVKLSMAPVATPAGVVTTT